MQEDDDALARVLQRDAIKYSDRSVEYRMGWAIERLLYRLALMGMEKSYLVLRELFDEYVTDCKGREE